MVLPQLIEAEKSKCRKAVMDFLDKVITGREQRLQAELFVDELIKTQDNVLETLYFDLSQLKKKCDNCTYMTTPPKEGTFFDKTDFYLKERSKWAMIFWGIIISMATVIVGIYLFWFTQVANNVADIKTVMTKIVTKVELNTDRLDRLEQMHLK